MLMLKGKQILAGVLVAATMMTCTVSVSAEFITANDDTIQYIVDGEPVTGWFTYDGERFYANSDGTLAVSQWKTNKEGSTRYYFTSDGSVATGFVRIKGKTYYFNNKGVMQKGWVKTKSGKRYFSSVDGTMRTGWLNTKSGKKYYCMPNTGYAATGWQKINGAYYYFDKNGVMNTDDMTVNGVKYTFESDGRCLQFTEKANNMVANTVETDGKVMSDTTTSTNTTSVKTYDGVRSFDSIEDFATYSDTFTYGTKVTSNTQTEKYIKNCKNAKTVTMNIEAALGIKATTYVVNKTKDIAAYANMWGIQMLMVLKDGKGYTYDMFNQEYTVDTDLAGTEFEDADDVELYTDVKIAKMYTVNINGKEYLFEHDGKATGFLYDAETLELYRIIGSDDTGTSFSYVSVHFNTFDTIDDIVEKYGCTSYKKVSA